MKKLGLRYINPPRQCLIVTTRSTLTTEQK